MPFACRNKPELPAAKAFSKSKIAMDADLAVNLARNAVYLSLIIATPVLVASIVVGLAISIMQAVTQIQEQTISFVPKIVVMLAVLLITLPWILNRLIDYSTTLIRDIPTHFESR